MSLYNKKEWKEFIESTEHSMEFLHKEDLEALGLSEYENQLPLCLEKNQDQYQVFLSSKEIDVLQTEQELIELFKKKL